MSSSWLPNKLGVLNTFATNFSTLITASPAKYGLLAADATAIAAAVAAYTAAYTAATTDNTRTKVTVATLATQRAALSVLMRSYGRVIRANAGVADNDKIALGLVVPSYQPSPVPAPSTMPILGIIGSTPGEITLSYRDQNSTPKSRAKPAGVAWLELRASVSTSVVSDPATLEAAGTYTVTPFVLTTAAGDKGKTTYIAARWVNRKGQCGPWSAIISSICN